MSVTLGGLPLDGFQRCPGHGFSKRDIPIAHFWLERQPPLGVPDSNLKNNVSHIGHPGLGTTSHYFDPRPPKHPARAAAILSTHVDVRPQTQDLVVRTRPDSSSVYWIRHGVVVLKEELPVDENSVSVALFICADDIKSDLTGFGVAKTEKDHTFSEVCHQLNKKLNNSEVDLELIDRAIV